MPSKSIFMESRSCGNCEKEIFVAGSSVKSRCTNSGLQRAKMNSAPKATMTKTKIPTRILRITLTTLFMLFSIFVY